MTAAVAVRTRRVLGEAVHDARAAWSPWHTAAAALVALAALVPVAPPRWVHVDSIADSFYVALAATGLWVSVGLVGLPSLGQGAFMAIGAFAVALLTAKAGWPAPAATIVGVAAAAAGGVVAGVGVVRLRPVFVAVTTWILTWGVVLFLLAFPSISGGAQGLVVPLTLSVAAHYELALALLVVAVLAGTSLARGHVGIELRAVRAHPAAAEALGVATARRRLGAFVCSGAVAGLAGALSVQLVGVADAGDYGPYLSFRLLVAVLIGGAASALGPAAGVAGLALVTGAAGTLGTIEGIASERFDPMLAALFLLAVLALGGSGIVPWARRLVAEPRAAGRPAPGVDGCARTSRVDAAAAGVLAADGLVKRFGALAAADGVSLRIGAGEVCALVGPNGSGKTTVLRMLAGAIPADAGRVLLDGRDVTRAAPRERALLGIVRTLQSAAAFGGLSVLENVLVGAGLHSVHGSALRTAAATPLARAEASATRRAARRALAEVGLEWAAELPAAGLPGPEQRLLGVAAALAARPRVLLLDEPSAGGSVEDVRRLARVIRRLREREVAVLIVEHNLRLVRSVADRVVVMAAGSVIAAGAPADVAADPAVRAAYLGTAAL